MKRKTVISQNLKKEDVENAYYTAAKVVAAFGDSYLPIFERLHAEIKKYNESSIVKSIALAVASEANFPATRDNVEQSTSNIAR